MPILKRFSECRPGILVLAALTFFLSIGEMRAADPLLQFNRDIRPILTESCFSCHGPDSAARKADLRLDLRDAAIDMNAIVPGDLAKSELIRRIESNDPDQMMPPPASKKVMSAEHKAVLKKWIEQGAAYQPHWSFLPPVRASVPSVKNEAWVKNPIDAFVLSRLEALGLSPAPEADRRTLARRLSLDLTGLPPKPENVDRFVEDRTPNAYEKYVDTLLDSPHWGEHRGRYWLDVSRYADSHGIHFDNFREMWSYRDNVIAAFNQNISFDRFTIEQLAGDLLPNPTLEQLIASGFNRCNITTNEGGIIDEEYLVMYDRDRTETVAQVWLGLTAGCAVCHNHKFDPLSQREFYELAAFFNNTSQAARDGNIKDTPPIVAVPTTADRARYDALQTEIEIARQSVESHRVSARYAFEEWMKTATLKTFEATLPTRQKVLQAHLNEGQGKIATISIDGNEREIPLMDSIAWTDGPASKALEVQGVAADIPDAGDFEKNQPFSVAAWVRLHPNDSAGSLVARMDRPGNAYRGWDFWVQGRRIGTHIVASWPGDALKVVAQKQIPGNEWTHVAMTYDGSSKASGVKIYYNGKIQPTNIEVDQLKGSIKTTVNFRIGQRAEDSPINGAGIQDLLLYQRELSVSDVEALAKATRLGSIFSKANDDRTGSEKSEIYPWWLNAVDQDFQNRSAKLASLETERNQIKSRGTVAHIMNEKKEEAMAYVLYRGEYDKRRDPVKPNTPAALPPFPVDQPKNRLGLANWILDPANPLTTRVTVNRFWQELFGVGLVRTSGDFGIAGDLPSNQELLDWMAIEFREGTPNLHWPLNSTTVRPWDIKRFFRLIVTSNTYRQAAIATKAKLEKDPQNRLISRGPRFRMDAEMIRDYALAASGLLVEKIGGPSVKPYQPEGVWEAVAMKESNTHDYRRDSGENLYRRSMYTFWKRSAPPASMEIFNATARETCTVRRERTNTPLQALVTLNDTQFVEAARHLAQSVVQSAGKEGAINVGGNREVAINLMAMRLLSRPLRDSELAIIQKSLDELTDYYQSHHDDAAKLISDGESKPDPSIKPDILAAWTMLANELMNMDEVLNK